MRGCSLVSAIFLCQACGVVKGLFDDDETMRFQDPNNYLYSADLEVERVEVQPASDLTIRWSSLGVDVRGRTVDPTTIDRIAASRFTGAPDVVLPQTTSNDLSQSDASDIYLLDSEGVSTAQLADFEITGVGMDVGLVSVDPDATWMLSLLDLPQGRVDLLSSIILVPTEGSTNTEVDFSDLSSDLDVFVDLHSAPPLEASAGSVPTFDWSGANVDVFGHPFDDQIADELLIAHYATEDLAEIEANFLQLDTFADEIYSANAFALRALSLGEAIDEDGNAFAGFTADGTWLIGIVCTTCNIPTPLLLTVVDAL